MARTATATLSSILQTRLASPVALVYVAAAVIQPLLLARPGYRWGGKLTMLVGAGAGAWLAWAFYGPLVRLWRACLVLGMFLAMLAAFVYVLQILWGS